jgi:carbon monoxide dehydrogenase subunit G
MPLKMTGEVLLPAFKHVVWEKLNDPAVLRECIPGCEALAKTGATSFTATAKVKLGPVSATFNGIVELSELDPPNGYRISGQGDGGLAGFAKGGARVALAEAPGGGTVLTYDVEASVGGKIAQLGGRLIDGVAKRNADSFFTKFAEVVSRGDG